MPKFILTLLVLVVALAAILEVRLAAHHDEPFAAERAAEAQ
jgi:Tfp pilus assembly protein PilX